MCPRIAHSYKMIAQASSRSVTSSAVMASGSSLASSVAPAPDRVRPAACQAPRRMLTALQEERRTAVAEIVKRQVGQIGCGEHGLKMPYQVPRLQPRPPFARKHQAMLPPSLPGTFLILALLVLAQNLQQRLRDRHGCHTGICLGRDEAQLAPVFVQLLTLHGLSDPQGSRVQIDILPTQPTQLALA